VLRRRERLRRSRLRRPTPALRRASAVGGRGREGNRRRAVRRRVVRWLTVHHPWARLGRGNALPVAVQSRSRPRGSSRCRLAGLRAEANRVAPSGRRDSGPSQESRGRPSVHLRTRHGTPSKSSVRPRREAHPWRRIVCPNRRPCDVAAGLVAPDAVEDVGLAGTGAARLRRSGLSAALRIVALCPASSIATSCVARRR
jgi:hypothetical protein